MTIEIEIRRNPHNMNDNTYIGNITVQIMVYFNAGIDDDKKWRVRCIDDRQNTNNNLGKNDNIDFIQPNIIGYGFTPKDAVNDFKNKFVEWFFEH